MSGLVIYQMDDGSGVSVRLEGDSIWLTQKQLSEILDTSTDNIGLHLKNIYTSGELIEATTTENFSVVQQEGHRSISRTIRHYNLDAIISVGYRVNSKEPINHASIHPTRPIDPNPPWNANRVPGRAYALSR